MRPTMRSRTGKLPVAPKKSIASSKPATEDENWTANNDTPYTESDDDHDEKLHRAAKRSKTTAKGPKQKQSVKAALRKKKGRLQALPSMPLDILYEIFGHLAPGDLVRLSRVTKAFRQLLLSKQSAFLWKQAFEDVDGTPPCPPDMTELAWANLLFGGSFCHNCGAKSVHKVLFDLRRRLCNNCISTELLDLYHIAIPARYNNTGYIRYDLTTALPAYHNPMHSARRHRSWFFNPEDVDELFEDLDIFCNGVQGGDLTKLIREFFSKKQRDMKVRSEHTQKCQEWENTKTENRGEELGRVKKARQQQITSHFLKLGFEEKDLGGIWKVRDVSVAKPLTAKAWERLFPILEPIAKEGKARRLQAEVRRRHDDRVKAIEETYWKCVHEFLAIKEMIDQDVLDLTEEWRSQIEAAIHAEIGSMRDALLAHKIKLASMVPNSSKQSDDPFACFNLATTVFRRLTYDTAYYGCTVLAVNNGPSSYYQLEYCDKLHDVQIHSRGRALVMNIIQELGLDETTTTAVELDELDARFLCNMCPPRKQWDPISRQHVRSSHSHSWRTMVNHIILEHAICDIRQLTPEETADAKERTNKLSYDWLRQPCWGCLHCNNHLPTQQSSSTWWTLEKTKEHLASKHAIGMPKENTDYFWSPAFARTAGRLVIFPMPEGESQSIQTI